MKCNSTRFSIVGIFLSLLITGYIIPFFSSRETRPTLEEGIVRVQIFYNEQCDLRGEINENYTKVKERMSRYERKIVDSLFLENRQMLDSSALMIAGAFPDSLDFDVRKNLLLSAMREMKQALRPLVRICTILAPYLGEDESEEVKQLVLNNKKATHYESLLFFIQSLFLYIFSSQNRTHKIS
ncbi:MAG: hypothetical protein WCV80_02025 [Candidatus Paceibacterota bacterium]|jgi:hypothetical protein